MELGFSKIGNLKVSKLIIGGNPFSGFSHQGAGRDDEMKRYYTVDRIKKTLARAERLGINTHMSRADHHVMRYLMEYWDQGGRIQWFAQTCTEIGAIERGVQNAILGGAKACYIHGGQMDYKVLNRQTRELAPAIKMIRSAGMVAGVAGHNPRVFEWAMKNLDVDFYMCCYYNPARRDKQPEHVHGAKERFSDHDRDAMAEMIQRLDKPVIHYKVLAAGRNDPARAFDFVAGLMKPNDAVCVGIYTNDFPDSIRQNIKLLAESLRRHGKPWPT